MNTASNNMPAPSDEIDAIIAMYDDWRGEILARLRKIILEADPVIVEQVKWKMPTRPLGLLTWSHSGMFCFAEIWKDNVKLLFTKGAQLQDPAKLFNARLKSADTRAIEFRQDDAVDQDLLTALVHEAVELNQLRQR